MTQGYDWQVLRHRDKHRGGIGWEMVKVTHERTAQERLRAAPDRRLLAAMDVWQGEAFLLVAKAHGLLNAGLGMQAQDMARVKGASLHDPAYSFALLEHYKAWKEFCKLRYLSPMMAEDVVVGGMSPHESDRLRKMKNGTAKKNLLDCLSAWWEVRCVPDNRK